MTDTYLYVAGIPIQVLTDKGSETGKVAAVQSTLR